MSLCHIKKKMSSEYHLFHNLFLNLLAFLKESGRLLKRTNFNIKQRSLESKEFCHKIQLVWLVQDSLKGRLNVCLSSKGLVTLFKQSQYFNEIDIQTWTPRSFFFSYRFLGLSVLLWFFFFLIKVSNEIQPFIYFI